MLRVISVNVGTPREIGRSRGNEVLSSIMKEPVAGPVVVRKTNLQGDRQADMTVHGGEQKAVYLYPSEHYPYWKEKFPGMKMPRGTFGENLTTEGLMEEAVSVGDQLGIGTATFVVTKPRFPCFKLGMRFQTQTMIKSFLESGRSGFYLGVVREGKVEAADAIARVRIKRSSDTIASIVRTVKRGE